MRTLVFTAVAALGFAAVGAAALAQNSAPPALPRLLSAYSQPEITPGLCRNVNANQTDCIIPAMSAGRYIIHAAGTSTSQGADAKQQLIITVGPHVCANFTDTLPWPSGARTFKIDCDTTVLTDKPMTISVHYGDFHATIDPKGPLMSVERAPWEGILSAQASVPKQ